MRFLVRGVLKIASWVYFITTIVYQQISGLGHLALEKKSSLL